MRGEHQTTTNPSVVPYTERALLTDFSGASTTFSLKFSNKSIEKAYKESIIFGKTAKKSNLETTILPRYNFFLSYYGTSLTYVFFYISNHSTEHEDENIFYFQISLILGVLLINSGLFIITFATSIIKGLKADLLQFVYFSTCIVFILNTV